MICKKLTFSLAAFLLTSGVCVSAYAMENTANQDISLAKVQEQTSAELKALFNDYNDEYLSLQPFLGSLQGKSEYNAVFGDYLSDAALTRTRQLTQKYYDKINAIDTTHLSAQDKISYRVFKADRRRELESYENNVDRTSVLMPINQFVSIASYLPIFGSGQSIQPFNTVADYENWIARASQFPEHVKAAIERMREGIESGVVLPKVLAEKVVPQLKAHVVDDVEQSAFYLPITMMPETFSESEKKAITTKFQDLIEQRLIPAYKEYTEFFEREYIPNARPTHGLIDIPNGEAVYANAIKTFTTTDMTADEIHKLGLQKVEYLYDEMKKVKARVGFEGDMQAFFTHLKSDPKFFFDSPQDLLDGYEALRNIINPRLNTLFNKQPKTDYIIMPIESFREESAAAAQYFPGSPDGSRPGVFYVNTSKLDTRPKWEMNALSIHEASPGHHFQISLNNENTNLPPFRQFGNYTAFVEGWALYSETLGMEMGMYDDPYQYFGMLYLQIWRANRLVVDTGIHAKGWTREQAIEFMMSNSPVAESEAIAEVERYMALPGQALAYMVGKLKIDELRAFANEQLKDDFSLSDFHNEILADGSMPLEILESKIVAWVKGQKDNAR